MYKKMRNIVLTTLLVVLALTGCSKKEVTSKSEKVKIVDSTGKEVEVTTNPKKVAIFIPQALDILDSVGIDKTGIETLGIQKNDLPEYLKAYNDDKYLNVGTLFEADLDVVDLMKPDLIIYGGRFGAEGRVAEGKTINEIKERYKDIEFVNLEFGDDNFEANIKANFNILSTIFPGVKATLDKKVVEISEAFAAIREKSKDYAALFIMPNAGNLQFYGKNSRFGYLYSDFGFKPAVDSDEKQSNHGNTVSPEFIMKTNPEIIVLLDREAVTSNKSGAIADFKNNALIQNTDAFKNNKIFELDVNAWYIMQGAYTSSLQMVKDLNNVLNGLK